MFNQNVFSMKSLCMLFYKVKSTDHILQGRDRNADIYMIQILCIRERERHTHTHTQTHTHTHLQQVGCKVKHCRLALVGVWCLGYSLSCAVCPGWDTVLPWPVSPRHMCENTVEKNTGTSIQHAIQLPHQPFTSLILSYFTSLTLSYRTPLCGKPLWFTGEQLACLHWGRLFQVRTFAGWCHSVITSQFLDTDDVSALGSVPTWWAAL